MPDATLTLTDGIDAIVSFHKKSMATRRKKMENSEVTLPDVQAVYDGPEGDLWELIMGEQIHIGGLSSSMQLAEAASIAPESSGIDLCCCSGAGMRFLLRFCQIGKMVGVDATQTVVSRGVQRSKNEGYGDRTSFVQADVTETPLPDGEADFIWGEDAWCYVVDKPKLISEAVRLVRSGGTIAFTDWVQGPVEMTEQEMARFLGFMKFPNLQSIPGYRSLLEAQNCEILHAEDTGRYAECVQLYIDMLTKQLTYDALKIIGFDMELMQAMGGEMQFMKTLADEHKIIQGLFVATKN
jgi:ubiquinone/menaquinone biosynthesis C-methylase UbiE